MKHIIIPDVQAKPTDDYEFLRWIGEYIADEQPDVIIQIGDFADLESLSSYDVGKKSFEGRTYKADIDASILAMDSLMLPILSKQVKLEKDHKKRWKPKMYLTLGNHEHRIDKAINNDRKLEGLISVNDLKYEEYGWEVIPFLKPITIDGIVYCHYMCSGVMGKPVTTARLLCSKMHMSTIVGHQQGRDVAFHHRADGKNITCIIAGSCYKHDEGYLNHQTNNHWRGIIKLENVNDGEFDEQFLSLKQLENLYAYI